MVYLDTNILVYASINQDETKRELSLNLVDSLACSDSLVLSVLSLQELSFTLAKLGMDYQLIQEDIAFYRQFVISAIDLTLFDEAHSLAVQSKRLTSLNDALHVVSAKRHASKLITFDKDFIAFQSHTNLPIEILR